MPTRKAKHPGKTKPRNALRELFQGAIPASPLAAIVREAAEQEGWAPDWMREAQKVQKAKAGTASGISRRGLTEIRRSFVAQARMRISEMSGEHRRTPYSEKSLAALRKEYNSLLTKNADDPDPLIGAMHSALSAADRKSLRQVSHDTLLKDLKAIRRSQTKT